MILAAKLILLATFGVGTARFHEHIGIDMWSWEWAVSNTTFAISGIVIFESLSRFIPLLLTLRIHIERETGR